jgi:casein kinase I family protein HRR25
MKFLIYCRELQFEERPDYNYLINLLEEILEDEDFNNDFIYDWDMEINMNNNNNNKKEKENSNLNDINYSYNVYRHNDYKSELKKKGRFFLFFFFLIFFFLIFIF